MNTSTPNTIVLLSDHPLPSGGRGSWSQRIEYLLQQYNGNGIDYLICNQPNHSFAASKTSRFVCKQYPYRWLNKLFPYFRYRSYFKVIDKLIKKHNRLVLCVLDSQRVKHAIWYHIKRCGLGEKVSIVYYHCGFSKFLTASQHETFVEGIRHCIYLTDGAYIFELKHNPSLPFAVSILPNPIDATKYFTLSVLEKNRRKEALNWSLSKLHFVWISYDRPKKGLDVILKAWELFSTVHQDVQLHVIGATRAEQHDGVIFYGQVRNWDVDKFLMGGDVGLFSPLWNEGFSLALAQMISCGMPVLASNVGCVPDFFIPGQHGIAIDTPNIPYTWYMAMLTQRKRMIENLNSPVDLQDGLKQSPPFLTYDEWCSHFCAILEDI